jgi:hypothetical protein
VPVTISAGRAFGPGIALIQAAQPCEALIGHSGGGGCG